MVVELQVCQPVLQRPPIVQDGSNPPKSIGLKSSVKVKSTQNQ